MQHLVVFVFAALLISCAGARQQERTEGDSNSNSKMDDGEEAGAGVVTVTAKVDAEPEPVGGLEAIHAAVQEPEEVWKANKSGSTVVEARVNASGKIIGTKVHKSSGYPGMDAEAMLAVSRVRWKPARKNNRPVEAVVRVTVDFNSSLSSKY